MLLKTSGNCPANHQRMTGIRGWATWSGHMDRADSNGDGWMKEQVMPDFDRPRLVVLTRGMMRSA